MSDYARHVLSDEPMQRRARPPNVDPVLLAAVGRAGNNLNQIETQLAPTLSKGDVIILDNLSSHKSAYAAEVLRNVGAWFLFLPPYSPDLNPIEMAFSKLKALIRKAAARTYGELWNAVGNVCDLFSDEQCFNLFSDEQCFNFLKAAGYGTD